MLQRTLSEMDREEIEAHIEQVRLRRMIGAMEYAQGVQEKWKYEIEKIQKLMKGQYESLGRELNSLDRALERVEARMVRIDELRNNLGLLEDYGEPDV